MEPVAHNAAVMVHRLLDYPFVELFAVVLDPANVRVYLFDPRSGQHVMIAHPRRRGPMMIWEQARSVAN